MITAEESAIDGAPTREELTTAWQETYRLVQDLGPIPDDPDAADQWGAEALQNWARSEGIDLSDDEISKILRGDLTNISNEAGAALVNMSSAAVLEDSGIDPGLAGLTVNSLVDGELSESEGKAIIEMAGATIGGSIGGPIGAVAGAFIAGAITSFLGLGGPSKEERERIIREDRERRKIWHQQVVNKCSAIRSRYWADFDNAIEVIANRHLVYEKTVEGPVPMRWFNTMWSLKPELPPCPDYFEYNKFLYNSRGALRSQITALECRSMLTDTGKAEAPERCSIRAVPEEIQILGPDDLDIAQGEGGRTLLPGDIEIQGVPRHHTGALVSTTFCKFRPATFLGHIYPPMTIPAHSKQWGVSYEAFAAWGHRWLPTDTRIAACDPDQVPFPHPGAEERFRFDVENLLNREVNQLLGLHTAKVAIQADLYRSAAAAMVEKDAGYNSRSKIGVQRRFGALPIIVAGGAGFAALALFGRR